MGRSENGARCPETKFRKNGNKALLHIVNPGEIS